MKKGNIKPETVSLSDLFDSKTLFIVPAYQRPYEWKAEQVEKLLENLCDSFERSEENMEEAVCLLGTLQFNIIKKEEKNLIEKEIIDGHQRITTLYLLKRYLGFSPNFHYKNEINNSESIEEFLDKDKNEVVYKIYKDNFQCIKEFFEKGERKKIDTKKFNDYIDDQVVFISISIEECNSIDDTLRVFDTLNTTGLSLEVKDIFKINLSDYLSKKTGAEEKSETIRKINEAYDGVNNPIEYNAEKRANKYDSIYILAETDLLDTYRFYLISQMKDHSWAAQLRQSNSAFFEEVFQNKKGSISIELEDFCNLSKCMKETQKILRERDLKVAETAEDMVLSCSRELLDWSGYSRIKNLYYYIVFDVYRHKNCEVNDDIIRFTDRVTNCIWRYCSILRFVRSKIVNDAFKYVGEALFESEKTYDDLNDYAKRIEDTLFASLKDEDMQLWYNGFDSFKELLTPEGNVKECNKPHLLMFLSYIDDACNVEGGKRIIDTRGKIGYWIFNNKSGLDIEHILSYNLYQNEKYVNSIGNLMYLPKSINRALGKKLTTYNGDNNAKGIDFENKIECYKKDNEDLACIKAFIKDYKSVEFIEDRNKKKIDFIKKVYKFDEIFAI